MSQENTDIREEKEYLQLTGWIDEKKIRENINDRKSLEGTIDCIHCCKACKFQARGLCTYTTSSPSVNVKTFASPQLYKKVKNNSVHNMLAIQPFESYMIANVKNWILLFKCLVTRWMRKLDCLLKCDYGENTSMHIFLHKNKFYNQHNQGHRFPKNRQSRTNV